MFDLLFIYEAIYHSRRGWQACLLVSLGLSFRLLNEYAILGALFLEYSHVFVRIRANFAEAVGLSWSCCVRPGCLLIAGYQSLNAAVLF